MQRMSWFAVCALLMSALTMGLGTATADESDEGQTEENGVSPEEGYGADTDTNGWEDRDADEGETDADEDDDREDQGEDD